jgi:hypothetical protein
MAVGVIVLDRVGILRRPVEDDQAGQWLSLER